MTSIDTCSPRTVWEIIRTCVVAVFSCAQVAIHPNILVPNAGWLDMALCRLQLVGLTLFAPEIIMIWAIRQWIVARRLAQKQLWYVCFLFAIQGYLPMFLYF